MASDKPNVVFILTDDQGVWAAGCYGNPEIRTPGIDRIAATGMRFENFFVETLVIFASDNGFSCGQHGFWGKGNGTYPLNMYENSVKIPFLASLPGRIPEGHVQKAMVCSYDFMPTLLDFLVLPLPEGRNLPGQSFLPVLLGEQDAARDNVVIYDEYGDTRMVRSREWKYIHRYPRGPNELYDLVKDPDERANRVEDPNQAARIAAMRKTLEGWFAEYVEPEKDGRARGVSGGGKWENDRPASAQRDPR